MERRTTIAQLPADEAYLLKGRLEAEEIPAWIVDEATYAGLPATGKDSVGLEVQVADQHVKEAEAVLRSVRESSPPPAKSEEEPYVDPKRRFFELVGRIFDPVETMILIFLALAALSTCF